MLVRLSQSENAPHSILVTLSGIVILVRPDVYKRQVLQALVKGLLIVAQA